MKTSVHYLLLLAASCLCGCVSDIEAGRAEAQRDLARGVLQWHYIGGRHAAYLDEEYWPLLKSRYDITVIDHGCLIDDRTLRHSEGYNEVMDAETFRRFGTNFWQPLLEEAKANYAARHSLPK